jgi:DNA polymerase I-like protein with 3'-5' exonuclease and polymerase domains
MLDLPDLEKAAKDAGTFSLDTETTSLDILTARLVCITFAVKDRTWIVPFAGLPGAVPLLEAKEWLNEHLFNDSKLTALVHNVKFDIPIMTRHGFNIQCRVLDTMIAEYITNEYGAANPQLKKVEPILGLKQLVKKYFNIDRYDYEETLLFLDPKGFIQYARDDASDVWRLWHEIHLPALARDGTGVQRLFYDIEMPLVSVVMEMESSGLYIDINKMDGLLKDNAVEIEKLSEKIWKIAGKKFNIASNDVLSDILFRELKIDPKDTEHVKKSTPSHPLYATGKSVLKKLHSSHKIIPLVEDYRKAAKLQAGFLNPLLEKARLNDEHRIYPEFLQARTLIGRFASRNPNGQNMPRKGGVRDCICAPPGFRLVVGDESQIEYRMLAHQSKDPNLIKLYNENPDADVHQWVADTAKIERDQAKCLDGDTIVFTAKGPRTINSIVNLSIFNTHCPIDEVELYNGSGGTVKAVSAIAQEEKECVYVISRYGILCCTKEHRLQLKGGELAEAGNLVKGQALADSEIPKITGNPISINLNPFSRKLGQGPCSLALDEDWAYFAGIFHGDGSVSGHTPNISHGSGKDYENWRSVIKDACKKIGLPITMSGDLKTTRLGERVVLDYLEQLNLVQRKEKTSEGAHRLIRVPAWVLSGGESIILSYLAGLFDTDGTISTNGSLNFTTKYPEYAGQVSVLIRALGCPVSIETCWNKTYSRWYYRVHARAAGLDFLAKNLPLRSEKKEKLLIRVSKKRLNRKRKENEVLLILPAGKRRVYDVQVNSLDHLYLQGGFIGHNSIGFGMLFGLSDESLAASLKISISEAKKLREKWISLCVNVPKYKSHIRAEVIRKRYVETIWGRRRRFAGIAMDEFRHRQAFHFTISGSAADVIKIGMVKLHKKLKELRQADPRYEKVRMLAQVHDELVLQAPEDMVPEVTKLLKDKMEDIGRGSLRVPIIADVNSGITWSAAKKKPGEKKD